MEDFEKSVCPPNCGSRIAVWVMSSGETAVKDLEKSVCLPYLRSRIAVWAMSSGETAVKDLEKSVCLSDLGSRIAVWAMSSGETVVEDLQRIRVPFGPRLPHSNVGEDFGRSRSRKILKNPCAFRVIALALTYGDEMKIQFDDDDLAPLIERVVVRVLEQRETDDGKLGKRIAYTESEAATLIGVKPYVLRDCRLRGEVIGSRIGKRVMYSREELLKLLAKNKTEGC